MDIVTVPKRKHAYKKENKENAEPAFESKSVTKREKQSAPLFQLKSNKKEETLVKNDPIEAKDKQSAIRSTQALKKTMQMNKRGNVTDVKQRQTHSQAFFSEQAVKHKKMVKEAPKPPAVVPSSKPAPGMYKGKIVQSKIGSIWKSSASIPDADPKPSAPKVESQRVGNVTKSRSKSVSDQLGRDTHKHALTRSKSVSERPAQVSKSTITSRPPAVFHSARLPARAIPATLTSTGTRNIKAAATKGGQISKPKVPATDRKVNKPPVSSTISQYRLNMETAEERRAKLADWLASKGKTSKRPAMVTAAQSKTKVFAKPKAEPVKTQSQVEHRPVVQHNPEPEPEPRPAAHKQDSDDALCADTQRAEVTTQIQTPAIMNTTLDLLENSDEDLFDSQQDRVDDIVVNLCDALEAMETPSRCSEESLEVVCSEVKVAESNTLDGCIEEVRNEKPVDVDEQLKADQVKDEAESFENEVEMKEEAESDEEVTAVTPQREDASVVKYSVKTTPFLQSVKKTIEGEVTTSSRRKSNIKDLKFLTPVRRSCRIERKSSRLPAMLVDHDPCVTSLAELVNLDQDPNAYIYRKNTALLEDLPDQPRA